MQKEMCCERFQFMWKNQLLEERKISELHGNNSGQEVLISYTKGYRIRRSFFYFKRDTIFYHCPFCNVELIYSNGVSIPSISFRLKIQPLKIGSSSHQSPYQIPMRALKEALVVTKKRCKTWPPIDR